MNIAFQRHNSGLGYLVVNDTPLGCLVTTLEAQAIIRWLLSAPDKEVIRTITKRDINNSVGDI